MEEWFDAIWNNNIEKVKEFINQGVDVNIKSSLSYTALMDASCFKYKEIIELLLKHPNIDITIKDLDGYFFIVYFNDKSYNSILIDYDLQKEILNNQREDIILFIDKYNFTHPKIKTEYKELFQASDWGLI
jgi:ankyrin repeat protein